MCLAEVVVGPRAPASALLVSAALEVASALEGAIAPKALYQRLVALAPQTRPQVLALAAERHPLAAWLVRLSEAVEGEDAGLTHLQVTVAHPAFERACQVHAEAGHTEGLVAAAYALRRPEPAAALAAAGHLDAAARAVVRTLQVEPTSSVVAWAIAGWGPEADTLLSACVRHLPDAATARALEGWVDGLPHAASLLSAVRRALQAPGLTPA